MIRVSQPTPYYSSDMNHNTQARLSINPPIKMEPRLTTVKEIS